MLQIPSDQRLDPRNAANSLQIEGKGELPGEPYHWGGGRNMEHETTYIYMQLYVWLCMYLQGLLQQL